MVAAVERRDRSRRAADWDDLLMPAADTKRMLAFFPWPALWEMEIGAGNPLATWVFEAFVEAGYAVDLILPPSVGETRLPKGVTAHRIAETRIRPKGVLRRALWWIEFNARLVGRGLAVVARNGRPAFTYGISAHTIPAAALVASLNRVPSIGELYGTFLYPSLRDPLRPITQFEETLSFKIPVSRLVVMNDGTRGDRVAKALGVPDSRLRFWPNPIDRVACEAASANPMTRHDLGVAPDAQLLVSASRLTAWKRVDRIVRILPAIRALHPQAVLAVSGEGPSEEALRQLVADLGISDSVVFTGPLSRDDNLRLIAAADLGCCFYDFSNVGVTLLENLACGVPVVTLDTGATREFVQHRQTGFVLAPDDDRAAIAAIDELLSSDQTRQAMGDAARQWALENLPTVEQRTGWIVSLAEELVEARRRHAHLGRR